ncbi:hypothetical protein [Candidatus Hamiltonella defensa]|uniref:hypothetical protein n=1 Tax=Candidatus Williamhamiltonella defendens TaxID=138072 RepID=UPI0015828EDE|nr:hypothetical protein [Candidatus Hamiltonella defensa]
MKFNDISNYYSKFNTYKSDVSDFVSKNVLRVRNLVDNKILQKKTSSNEKIDPNTETENKKKEKDTPVLYRRLPREKLHRPKKCNKNSSQTRVLQIKKEVPQKQEVSLILKFDLLLSASLQKQPWFIPMSQMLFELVFKNTEKSEVPSTSETQSNLKQITISGNQKAIKSPEAEKTEIEPLTEAVIEPSTELTTKTKTKTTPEKNKFYGWQGIKNRVVSLFQRLFSLTKIENKNKGTFDFDQILKSQNLQNIKLFLKEYKKENSSKTINMDNNQINSLWNMAKNENDKQMLKSLFPLVLHAVLEQRKNEANTNSTNLDDWLLEGCEQQFDLNPKNRSGESAVYVAVKNGDEKAVKIFFLYKEVDDHFKKNTNDFEKLIKAAEKNKIKNFLNDRKT